MLNKDILEIHKQLREDCPDFYGLQSLSPHLATQIAFWIKEDRIHTIKRTIKNMKRKENRRKLLKNKK
jgi:hypothetical protein